MEKDPQSVRVYVKSIFGPFCNLAGRYADPTVLENNWLSDIDSTIQQISSVVPGLIERVLHKETRNSRAPYFVTELSLDEVVRIQQTILSEYDTFWIQILGEHTSTIGKPDKRAD